MPAPKKIKDILDDIEFEPLNSKASEFCCKTMYNNIMHFIGEQVDSEYTDYEASWSTYSKNKIIGLENLVTKLYEQRAKLMNDCTSTKRE
jgi:hypothetical protein